MEAQTNPSGQPWRWPLGWLYPGSVLVSVALVAWTKAFLFNPNALAFQAKFGVAWLVIDGLLWLAWALVFLLATVSLISSLLRSRFKRALAWLGLWLLHVGPGVVAGFCTMLGPEMGTSAG